MKENRTTYTIKEKVQETSDIVTLKLSCDEGIPEYRSGQFVTVFFEDLGNAEGKAYTISSEPSEDTLNLTVKGVGQFSNMICSMNIGDTLETSLPCGYFYSESDTSTLVMITGGIGVTPFRSIIVDSIKKHPNRKLIIFYSNKTEMDTLFQDEFKNLQLQNSVFILKNYITQQYSFKEGVNNGRIKVEDIINETKDIKDKEFLICGSIPFVRDFWKELKEVGIPEEIIYTEAFF